MPSPVAFGASGRPSTSGRRWPNPKRSRSDAEEAPTSEIPGDGDDFSRSPRARPPTVVVHRSQSSSCPTMGGRSVERPTRVEVAPAAHPLFRTSDPALSHPRMPSLSPIPTATVVLGPDLLLSFPLPRRAASDGDGNESKASGAAKKKRGLVVTIVDGRIPRDGRLTREAGSTAKQGASGVERPCPLLHDERAKVTQRSAKEQGQRAHRGGRGEEEGNQSKQRDERGFWFRPWKRSSTSPRTCFRGPSSSWPFIFRGVGKGTDRRHMALDVAAHES